MVEGAALEMLFRGNSNEGSNPSLSVSRSNDKISINRVSGKNFWVELGYGQYSDMTLERLQDLK